MIKPLGCSQKCYGHHTSECIILSDIKYLGQCGALDHLAEVAKSLGVEIEKDNVNYEAAQFKRHDNWDEGNPATLEPYDHATNVVRSRVGELSPDTAYDWQAPLDLAARSAILVRRVLAEKGYLIPGRHVWLRPFLSPTEELT